MNPSDEKKGVFWISFNDFITNFEVVTYNKIHDNYFYSFLKIKEINPSIIQIRVIKKTHCYFSIHQKHDRFYKNTDNNYSYSISRIIICKIDDNNFITEVLNGNFSVKQSTSIEVSLTPGKYLIYGEIDFVKKIYTNFVISNFFK